MKPFSLIRKNLFPFILLMTVISATLAFGRIPEMISPNFSAQWVVRDGYTLFLNGQGVHTASIFRVKVYEISLFLEKRSKDPEEILKSTERKVVLLKFLRDVDGDQLRSAFSDGFYENCATQCGGLKIYLDQLNSKIPDLRDGDSLEFQFLPTKVVLRSNLGNYSEVNAPDFGRVLLSIWLGSNPPSLNLKNRILGLSQ